MDVAEWKRKRITQDIEYWMAKYREAKKDRVFDVFFIFFLSLFFVCVGLV